MPVNAYYVLVAALALVAALVRIGLSSISARLDRLSRIEGKIDKLLEELDVRYDPVGGVPADVVAALDRGEKIEAIKRLRAATGLGLKEAKDRVDDVERARQGARLPGR